MPCRLPPFPAARFQQGTRRVEPDGALLQLNAGPQHHWASLRTSPNMPPHSPFCCFSVRTLPSALSGRCWGHFASKLLHNELSLGSASHHEREQPYLPSLKGSTHPYEGAPVPENDRDVHNPAVNWYS